MTNYGPKNRFSNIDYSGFNRNNYNNNNNNNENNSQVSQDNRDQRDSKEEDILKLDKEEKVDLKEPGENEPENWNLNGDEPDDSSEEKPDIPLTDNEQDNEEDAEKDRSDKTNELNEEDEEEEEEDNEDNNQYLRGDRNSTETEEDTDEEEDDGVAEKRSVTGSEGGNFGNRLGQRLQANLSATQRPQVSMHFQLGDNELINTKNSPFAPVQTTTESFLNHNQVMSSFNNDFMVHETTTPSVLLTTDSDQDIMGEEVLNNTIVTTTTIEPELESQLIKKRKPQRIGKWLDSETFELNEDELENDDEMSKPQNSNLLSNSMQSKISVKRVFNKPLAANRIARQNFADEDDGDELGRLARTLQGTPGEDYPIFGVIPRTTFSCRDQQWPGYYADIETQCQVSDGGA